MLNRILGKFSKEKKNKAAIPAEKDKIVQETAASSRRGFLKALGGITLATMGASSLVACEDTEEKERKNLEKFFDHFDMRALDAIPEKELGKKLDNVPAMNPQKLVERVAKGIKEKGGLDIDFSAFAKTSTNKEGGVSVYWEADSTIFMQQLQKIDKDASISSYKGGKSGENSIKFTLNGQDYELSASEGVSVNFIGPKAEIRWDVWRSASGLLGQVYEQNGSRYVNGYDEQGNVFQRVYNAETNQNEERSFTMADNGTKTKVDSIKAIGELVNSLNNNALMLELVTDFPVGLIVGKDIYNLVELIKKLPGYDPRYFSSIFNNLMRNTDSSDEFQHPNLIIDQGLDSIENGAVMNALWSHLNGYETYVYYLEETSTKVKDFKLTAYIVQSVDRKTGEKFLVTSEGLMKLDEDLEVTLAKDNEMLKEHGAHETLERIKI